MPSTDANLEFGIRFEADRLVNSFVDKKDLDTEMTVVRNEFEASENYSLGVLMGRVKGAAFPWHNYGRTVIGIKTDIERVPVDNLKAFYKRYYQPDNAVLVVTGRFDDAKVFRLVAETFGTIPKPKRLLTDTFTTEPVQDGERTVIVRRAGGTPALLAGWRIPGTTDPDYPALMVLQGVLGDQPQGRLHQSVVDTKKAATARCDLDETKEPGLFPCYATFKEGDATVSARDILLALMETPKPLTDDEVARSRDGWVSQFEQDLSNTDAVGHYVSNWAARGDWRLAYLVRDRLKAVTRADVERVWAKYFKPQNRTLGEYVPTAKPDRSEIPPAPDARAVLADFKGQEAVAQGEAFDPSPANIEARTRRITMPNGGQLILLPKKTRAQSVKVAAEFRIGSEASLKGQAAALQAMSTLLSRGTKQLDFKAFRSKLEGLRSKVMTSGRGQTVSLIATTQRPQVADVLKLITDAMKAPALDRGEFETLRAEILAELDSIKTEPQALGTIELQHALTPFPKEHPLAVQSVSDIILGVKAVTLEQVQTLHARFVGAQNASIAVVGDFDAAEVEKALTESFGQWTAKESYVRATDPFVAVKGSSKVIQTPDKANAWMGAGTTIQLNDDAPDYPAMKLALEALGGGTAGRLFSVLREQKGLSYGAYASLAGTPTNDRSMLTAAAIYAPQNVEAVEKGLAAEFARWATVTPQELEVVRSQLLQGRYQSRSNDEELVRRLAALAGFARGMPWEQKLDDALKAVTVAEVNAAVKKHFDPSRLVLLKAGDFKVVSPPK
jgi:zinc protease